MLSHTAEVLSERARYMKDKIESLLNECELGTLYEIQTILESLIARRETEDAALQDTEGRERRSEARFELVLRAKVKRITDVRDGEVKEYPATINDISKHGMRLRVSQAIYCYSRLVKVSFHSPGGDSKETYLEIVRIKEMFDEKEGWYELGCKCVSNEEARELHDAEAKMVRIRNSLSNKTKFTIFVVGDSEGPNSQMVVRMKLMGYKVYHLPDIKQLLHEKEMVKKPHLAIFCPETQLSGNMELVEEIRSKYLNLAFLAIAEDVNESAELLKAGMENCIMVHELGEFLSLFIEKSILSRKLLANSSSVVS